VEFQALICGVFLEVFLYYRQHLPENPGENRKTQELTKSYRVVHVQQLNNRGTT